jgi:hypothetical protein
MSEALDFRGVPHPVAPQARHEQVARLDLHQRPTRPVRERQDPCSHPQVIAAATQGSADPAEQIMRGWTTYIKHAVCKHHVESLESLACHAVPLPDAAAPLEGMYIRRHLTGRHGRWRKLSAYGIELFNIARCRSPGIDTRGSKVPTSWTAEQTRRMSTITLLSRGVAHVIDQGLACSCSTSGTVISSV